LSSRLDSLFYWNGETEENTRRCWGITSQAIERGVWHSNSEPEPDLAIVQRRAAGYRDHHPYPQNIYWLIEFSNTSLSKDLETKAKVYAAANIPEYGVVNLKGIELVVMRDPVDGEYQSQVTLTNGTVYPLSFPDLAVSVQRLLS